LVILYSIRWIPSVLILDVDLELLEDSEILLIINAREQYSHNPQCFSTKQATRLLEVQTWDHKIHIQDPKSKIRTGAIYKTTWEVDESLQTYLCKNQTTSEVDKSQSAASEAICFVKKKDRYLRLFVNY